MRPHPTLVLLSLSLLLFTTSCTETQQGLALLGLDIAAHILVDKNPTERAALDSLDSALFNDHSCPADTYDPRSP
jgi:hypothetical protein